jgi:hypothetical protein
MEQKGMQHVSLKAAIVLMVVGLQKPNRKSKAKDHKVSLAKRLFGKKAT